MIELHWSSINYIQSPTLALDTPLSPCTQIYGFGLPYPTMYDVYIMFFAYQTLHYLLTLNACNTIPRTSSMLRNFLCSRFLRAFRCPKKKVEILYQCATRFIKTPKWVVEFILLLGYHHIYISFLQHKLPILDVIIIFEIE